jgi:hypothetical protein
MAGRAELKHAGITRVHENFALEKKANGKSFNLSGR